MPVDSDTIDPGSLIVQILDVGQGDGIFIEFPGPPGGGRRTMLVDFGSTKNRRIAGRDARQYFLDHTKFGTPNQTLDYLILTHGDVDHYNQVAAFVGQLQVRINRVLHSGFAADYGSLMQNLRLLCPAVVISNGNGFNFFELEPPENFGGVSVDILAMNVLDRLPDAHSKNSNSIVLRLSYATRSIILSGDATHETEGIIRRLVEEGRFDPENLDLIARLENFHVDVLKVGHHGSVRTSLRPEWLRLVNPHYAFITSDRHGTNSPNEANGYRLPQQLAIDLILAVGLGPFGRLDNTVLLHSCIASYDPADYADYTNPDEPGAGVVRFHDSHLGERRWLDFPTTAGVFTSLVAMDNPNLVDGSVFDQGAQYEIRIGHDGTLDIFTTADNFGPRHPVHLPPPAA